MQENVSEVAVLREKIAAEYVAGKLGLYGLNSGTANHTFITARLERISTLHQELRGIVGEQAIAIVDEVIESLPSPLTRSHVLGALQHESCKTAETKQLCDCLEEMWETIDLATLRVGLERSHQIAFTRRSGRTSMLIVFQWELGESEETALLLDHMQEMWEIIDRLTSRFGDEQTQKIVSAPVSSPVNEIQPS